MDIALALALGVVALAMAYVGIHMTLHQPSEDSRNRYKWGFVGLGALSLVLIFLQVKRNVESQDRNTALLEEIRQRGEASQKLGHTIQRQGELLALQQAELKGIGLRPLTLPTSGPAETIRIVQRQTSREDSLYGYQVTYVSQRALITPILEFRFDGPVKDFYLAAVDEQSPWVKRISDRTFRATVMRSFEANRALTFYFSAAKPTKAVSVVLLD